MTTYVSFSESKGPKEARMLQRKVHYYFKEFFIKEIMGENYLIITKLPF